MGFLKILDGRLVPGTEPGIVFSLSLKGLCVRIWEIVEKMSKHEPKLSTACE